MVRSDAIPNNVDLGRNRKLLRALAHWQPRYLDWWRDMGPQAGQEDQVWLRTAVSAEPDGWARFEYVRMPEYRWGIFLSAPDTDRTIGFGDDEGRPIWSEVPGELRGMLRRLIVTQADTEPASVEQQRQLGRTAPSLYDLRNLFQVNVEEGRHLWAMVHLLHEYFGRDGREEAEALLDRRSGDPDRPRILSTFNQPCEDWLSFFCFTMFTDRDGKYQLAALAESAFEPLSRATRFMLAEEAFHLFVGESGVNRIVQRSCEATRADPNGDARAQGAIDLATIQKWIHHWFSSAIELFGGEVSSNAADCFATGIKGRFRERKRHREHRGHGVYHLPVYEDGRLTTREVPLRNAMNEVLRDEYVVDCERAVKRWNRTIESHGLETRLRLPSRRFNRTMGVYAGQRFDPEGHPIADDVWAQGVADWLPTAADRAYLRALMEPERRPGRFASWIAPPQKGLEGRGLDFEYVRLG